MGNIGASADYVNQVRRDIIRPATTLDVHRVARRPISDAPPIDVATISPPAPRAELLELHPDLPAYDGSQDMFRQLGGNDETVFFLALGLNDVQAAAKDVRAENQVLGGAPGA